MFLRIGIAVKKKKLALLEKKRNRDAAEERERVRLLASEPVISFGDHGRQRKEAGGGNMYY